MQRKRVLILSLVFTLVSAALAVASILSVSKQPNSLAQQERVDETVTPIVDFNAPEPTDPKEKALRRARSKLFDYAGDPAEAKKFSLTEASEPIVLDLPLSHGPIESPIPVQQADAVAIGTIKNAHAYLSNDKTAVYSEFTTSLEDVLLNDRSGSLFPGKVITTNRRGGTVKFPSGKTLVRGALGRTMPRTGNRYLLFLQKNEEGETFSVITAYELRNGKVIPLDGPSKGTRHLSQYAAYKNADETTFLNQVREAISKEGGKAK